LPHTAHLLSGLSNSLPVYMTSWQNAVDDSYKDASLVTVSYSEIYCKLQCPGLGGCFYDVDRMLVMLCAVWYITDWWYIIVECCKRCQNAASADSLINSLFGFILTYMCQSRIWEWYGASLYPSALEVCAFLHDCIIKKQMTETEDCI